MDNYLWWRDGVIYQIYPRSLQIVTQMAWVTCPESSPGSITWPTLASTPSGSPGLSQPRQGFWV